MKTTKLTRGRVGEEVGFSKGAIGEWLNEKVPRQQRIGVLPRAAAASVASAAACAACVLVPFSVLLPFWSVVEHLLNFQSTGSPSNHAPNQPPKKLNPAA